MYTWVVADRCWCTYVDMYIHSREGTEKPSRGLVCTTTTYVHPKRRSKVCSKGVLHSPRSLPSRVAETSQNKPVSTAQAAVLPPFNGFQGVAEASGVREGASRGECMMCAPHCSFLPAPLMRECDANIFAHRVHIWSHAST